jgi:hypothetical protein
LDGDPHVGFWWGYVIAGEKKKNVDIREIREISHSEESSYELTRTY